MAIIQTPTEENPPEEVKAVFETIKDIVSFVPKPTQLPATSPAILNNWWNSSSYFLQHPKLSRTLLTHIRMLVATHNEFPFCIEFNSVALKMLTGLSDDEVAAIRQDPQQAFLPENDKALLLFVLRAVTQPENVAAEDVEALHALGWTDEHIFEATYYGAWMVLVGLLFNAFKMHEG